MSEIAFLIIGAEKGGTTSLFQYMRRHPEIHMPADKEVAFFLDANYHRGWEWYRRHVRRGAPARALAGEASVAYMSGSPLADSSHLGVRREPVREGAPESLGALEDVGPPEPVGPLEDVRAPEDAGALEPVGPSEDVGLPEPVGALEDVVPLRIRRHLPRVRLICVLRDPVERAYSQHRMEVLEGDETRPFEQAIGDLCTPEALAAARRVPRRTNGYVVRGEYARVLAGFVRVFGREQLHAVFSSELTDQAVQTLSGVFDFVGVSSRYVPDNVGVRYREGAVRPRVPGLNLYAWQMRAAQLRPARTVWHALPHPLRQGIDRAYRVGSFRMAMWNARRGAPAERMPAGVRERLIGHYMQDSLALEQLLGRPVPWIADWRSQVSSEPRSPQPLRGSGMVEREPSMDESVVI